MIVREVTCYAEVVTIHAPETRETHIFLTEHFVQTC